MKKPLVVLFGRTNVGKSTLFNRLAEKSQAMVSPLEGTTRDSNLADIEWRGATFSLADTAGFSDDWLKTIKQKDKVSVAGQIKKQILSYLKKADLIVFVVDSKTSLLPLDKDLSLWLKKNHSDKKIILAANKADGPKDRTRSADFYVLSWGEPAPVSALTGSGSGDLLDLIHGQIFKPAKKPSAKKIIDKKEIILPLPEDKLKLCIVGKPNVGKSSLLNAILGYERVIVSPVPNTTREPQDTEISYAGQTIKLVDTAGISKKVIKHTRGKIKGEDYLTKYGVNKSLSVLKKSDVALLVLDINEDITHQDAKIMEEIIEKEKSVIIIANKWDMIPNRDTKKFTQYIRAKLPFAQWAPIQFVSAKTGEKVKKIMDLVIEAGRQRNQEISDSQLNTFLMKLIKIHKPSRGKGYKYPYIYSLKQIGVRPPRFQIRIGAQEDLHQSYVRFIENRLREHFNFLGAALKVSVIRNNKQNKKN